MKCNLIFICLKKKKRRMSEKWFIKELNNCFRVAFEWALCKQISSTGKHEYFLNAPDLIFVCIDHHHVPASVCSGIHLTSPPRLSPRACSNPLIPHSARSLCPQGPRLMCGLWGCCCLSSVLYVLFLREAVYFLNACFLFPLFSSLLDFLVALLLNSSCVSKFGL